jgi:alkylation response protein AidB-like acyl-CoA dehydrogenase
VTSELYRAAESLDAELGDPRDPANAYGFTAAVVRDEAEEFPEKFAAALRDAGLHLSYVPAAQGGRLRTLDDTLMRVRVAARRDVAVMPATMFSVTAVTAVLASGSDQQQRHVVGVLADGGAVGFALSEPGHGSDLLENSVELAGGYRLAGTKWMVGLGARCRALYVVGRTGRRGPGAFSAVLLDRAALPAPVTAPTSGMRGIDFARYEFRGVPVRAENLVGAEGRGLEAAMKALQLVRVLSTAANLAAADTALREAIAFVREHRVRTNAAAELPGVRRELAMAFAALAATDVVALASARMLHAAPRWGSVWSGVAKRIATELSRDVLDRCADLLATRSVLRTGLLQKLRRDNDMVRFIDTSPVATLRLLAPRLPALCTPCEPDDDSHAEEQILAATFDLHAPLPDFRPADLAVGGSAARLARLAAVTVPAVAAAPELAIPAERLLTEVAALAAEVNDRLPAADPRWLDRADRYCALHAAAACLRMWWHNRHLPLFGAPAGNTGWLTGCLGLLLDRAAGRLHRDASLVLADRVLTLADEGRLFSVVPLRLAEARAADREEVPWTATQR